MLRVRELVVRYGSITAVRSASLDLAPGETIAIVGPNGSGKTSLLSAIAGLVPASGDVSLDDRRLDGLMPEKRAAAGLAFVPDGRQLFGRLTVEQNLVVGTTTIRDRKIARAAIARIGDAFPILRELASQRAETLSGGEGQLLMIARALVASPSVLLVDEPFEGLSRTATAFVSDAFAYATANGAAVAVASPDPIDGARTIEMRHGALAEVLA